MYNIRLTDEQLNTLNESISTLSLIFPATKSVFNSVISQVNKQKEDVVRIFQFTLS